MKVTYTLTRNLYPYLLPSIMSLLEHNKVEKIYIFCEDDVFPYNLPKECVVKKVDPKDYFNQTNFNTMFTPMCLMRAVTSKLLPRVNKVLQLDVDTIIADDLTELWNTDMGDNWIAACDEKLGRYKPYGRKYYNAGVLLLNLKQIRKDHADDRLVELLNTKRLQYIDQDAWNIIGQDKTVELDVRWNECFATGITGNPGIVHYASYRQWWNGAPRFEYYARYKKLEKIF